MNASRFPTNFPPGSLLKQDQPNRHRKAMRRAQARHRDESYLDKVRQCPCLNCGIDPAGQAAHVRMTREGKPITGMGVRPSDEHTLPLCNECHVGGKESQHAIGEREFWHRLGSDPLQMCERLYRSKESPERMRALCFVANEIATNEDIR